MSLCQDVGHHSEQGNNKQEVLKNPLDPGTPAKTTMAYLLQTIEQQAEPPENISASAV